MSEKPHICKIFRETNTLSELVEYWFEIIITIFHILSFFFRSFFLTDYILKELTEDSKG